MFAWIMMISIKQITSQFMCSLLEMVQGADWFESALVDYDVCSNWGNWVAAAGLTGGRINHFNITKQSKVCAHKGSAHAALIMVINLVKNKGFFPRPAA